MNRGMMIKELAVLLHVTEDTVINWELRGMQPQKKVMGRVKKFIER